MGISQQQGVTTAHLMSTPRTGVYVPWRERRVTERAFFVGPEKAHRSILLQRHDSNEGVLISNVPTLILAHPNVFVKDDSSAQPPASTKKDGHPPLSLQENLAVHSQIHQHSS